MSISISFISQIIYFFLFFVSLFFFWKICWFLSQCFGFSFHLCFQVFIFFNGFWCRSVNNFIPSWWWFGFSLLLFLFNTVSNCFRCLLSLNDFLFGCLFLNFICFSFWCSGFDNIRIGSCCIFILRLNESNTNILCEIMMMRMMVMVFMVMFQFDSFNQLLLSNST